MSNFKLFSMKMMLCDMRKCTYTYQPPTDMIFLKSETYSIKG